VEFLGVLESDCCSAGTSHIRSSTGSLELSNRFEDERSTGVRDAEWLDTGESGAPGHSIDSASSPRARMRALLNAVSEYDMPVSPLHVHLFSTERGVDRGLLSALGQDQIERVLLSPDAEGSVGTSQVAALGDALRAAHSKSGVRPLAVPNHSLVRVQSGNRSVSPVFCCPGAGASVTDFVPLSVALGADCPVYGFQPRGMDSVHVPHSSVQAAAQLYLSELYKVSPFGGVSLVGHSFGGWVAFEMALRLQAAGRTVESLLLLDTDCPSTDCGHPPEYTRTESLMKLVTLYEEAAERPLDLNAEDLDQLEPPAQLSRIHEQLVQVGLLRPSSAPHTLGGSVRTFAAALRVSYTPLERFSGALTLVLAPGSGEDEAAITSRFDQQVAGWRGWASDVRLKPTTGNHVTLLKEPHVSSWVDCVRATSVGQREAPNQKKPPNFSQTGNSNFRSLVRRTSFGQNE